MKRLAILLALAVTLSLGSAAQAAMRVDIYGPGQNIVNLALAAPLTGPQKQANGMGAKLQKLVEENLSFLPFMRLTPASSVLGGTLLPGYEPPSLDFKRFQLAGSDIVVTTYWPNGDSGTSSVQIRAFETNTGGRLFGKEYPQVRASDLPEVADRFCADLLEVLTGSGAFFRSTLAFVKKSGRLSANVWLVKPTGRDLRQITNIKGEAMSPAWSTAASSSSPISTKSPTPWACGTAKRAACSACASPATWSSGLRSRLTTRWPWPFPTAATPSSSC